MKMKITMLLTALLPFFADARQWESYGAFEIDATKALNDVAQLTSPAFTNRLMQCIDEEGLTNEIGSAAQLLLAISEEAKSNNDEVMIGDTNALSRASMILDVASTGRNLWQKSCALTMLASANDDKLRAKEFFGAATNLLHQWDVSTNRYDGGVLYENVARHFKSAEMSPRDCLLFSAAVSALDAGMQSQYIRFLNLLPAETREFLDR